MTATAAVPADPIFTAAEASMTRARAELRLLAAIAPLGRYGLGMARRAGIGMAHFGAEDCRAILAALILADSDGRIIDYLATARLCRVALDDAGLWDATDCRPFIGGMQWGVGPLAHLFCGIHPRDAEAMLPGIAAELKAITERISA